MGNAGKYYLGLDIGTDSVGYAVTDTDYILSKFKGESMWGAMLFGSANAAADRRAFRTARRRLDRRQQRVQLLEELFAGEICKTDPYFFIAVRRARFSPTMHHTAYGFFRAKVLPTPSITGNIQRYIIS